MGLKVYFDGSGKEDNDAVVTVGGFAADQKVIESIETDWKEATGDRGFHLRAFGTAKCKLGSSNWDRESRRSFLRTLAGIVNRESCYIISASVEVDSYNKTLGDAAHPHELGPAFSACAFPAICLAEGALIGEAQQMQDADYVFEKGDREHEVAKVFADFNRSKAGLRGSRSYSFEPKHILLEPADLIAGMIQRCLVKAHKSVPCLENGKSRTPLNTFERFYSEDGVTSALVAGHDVNRCWIFNPASFLKIDEISTNLYDRHPKLLQERLRYSRYKPKHKA